MAFGYCNLSIIPLRKDSSHRSEMISQLLFGEYVQILLTQDDWYFVSQLSIGYEGWVQSGQIKYCEQADNTTPTHIVGIQGATASHDSTKINLLHGTTFKFDSSNKKWSVDGYDWTIEGQLIPYSDSRNIVSVLEHFISHYLDAPYLWGGRSLNGIDCSGLSQLFYNHLGEIIPRDAWQQAEYGTTVDFLTQVIPGDLAFFDNEEGKITHVGIITSPNTIFHASEKVRIDNLDNQGIFSRASGKYTHRLRIIKRIF